MTRFAKSPSTSSATYADVHKTEEYGYALPLGRGIERCPMPQFEVPPALDVSLRPSILLWECARD